MTIRMIVVDWLMFPATAIRQVYAKPDSWAIQCPRFITIIVARVYSATFYGQSFTANWRIGADIKVTFTKTNL